MAFTLFKQRNDYEAKPVRDGLEFDFFSFMGQEFIDAELEIRPVMFLLEMALILDDRLSFEPELGLVCIENDLSHSVSPFPSGGDNDG
jgi:hypothetical protein